MADGLEEYITLKLRGLEDAPRQLQETIALVKQLQETLDGLHKTQGQLQTQQNAASPQQQPAIQKQLNNVAYQLDQVTSQRVQAQTDADAQHRLVQQYAELAKRVQAFEQKRATTPPPPGPAENLSQGAAFNYATAAGELDHAQAKYKRARTDNSRQKWAGEIDRLQSQLENLPSELTRVAYEEPLKEIRRRVQNMAQQGKSVGNRDFAQIERDVSQGRIVTPEDDAALSARRIQAMAADPSRTRRLLNRMKDNVSGEWGTINLAYAAQEGGQAVSQYAALNMSGRRVTPEEQARAAYGFLPAVGGAVGALVGGWPGSLVGGGIGTGIEGVLDAKSERDEKLRLAGEELAQSMGHGASAGRAYSLVLENAAKALGTPVVELASSVAQIAHAVGGLNVVGAASLQARLQSQLGDEYAATIPAQLKAAASPFSQGYRDMLAGKTPQSAGAFNSKALYFAALGDRDTMDNLLKAGQALGTDPQIAYQQARISAANADKVGNTLLGIPLRDNNFSWNIDNRTIKDAQARIDALRKKADDLSASPAKAAADAFADAMQNGRDAASAGQSAAAGYGSYAQQALARGEGVAGLRAQAGGQTDALNYSRTGLLSQQATLQAQIARLPAGSRDASDLTTVLADVRRQLADVTGQLQSIPQDIFHAGLSEQEAAYGGVTGRLGVMGQRYALQGLSVDDGRTQGVYARQSGAELAEADRLTRLVADKHNFLRPEEREADRTQALALRFAATTGQQTEIFNRGQQEQAARDTLRMARNDTSLARAQTGGSTADVYAAQQGELTENLRQQAEVRQDIATLEQQGLGTYSQKLGLQTQLNTLIAQEARTRQQATEAAYASVSSQMADVNRGASAIAGQERFAGGTTAAYYGAAGAGLDAQAARVALLRQEADTTTDPKKKAGFIADYQEAALQLKNDTVAKLGVYEESPQDQFKRMSLEGKARRMAMSPYVPGSRLSVDRRLQEQDTREMAGITAQMQTIARSNRPDDDKQRALNSLMQQQQDVQDRMTGRASSEAEMMFSNRIANSVNSPSFYSRIGPSDSEAARAAERVGLGAQGARVFGYSRMQSYRDTMRLGFAAPDMNLLMYGRRPGDFPADVDGTGGVSLGSSGGGGTGGVRGGAGSAGGADTGLAHALSGLQAEIASLRQQGFQIRVTLDNPTTGAKASQTVNAVKNHDARDIMNGGRGR